jgi:hypothetical protein
MQRTLCTFLAPHTLLLSDSLLHIVELCASSSSTWLAEQFAGSSQKITLYV